MSISEFIQFFLSICGGVSIIGGAAAVIFKWIAPAFRLNKRVEILEDHDKRDFETLKRIAERDSLILEVMSTMLDSQNAGTRAILDYLCNEKISNLQAENNDLRRAASQDRQSALLTTAMASQTQQLINAINPAPIPAYQVPNPNTFYGCGCNTGCNC